MYFEEKVLQTEIMRTLLHEAHHVLRWGDPGYGETLLEMLVSEGLADNFELFLTGFFKRPWNKALTNEELFRTRILVKKHLHSRKIDFGKWFLGSNPKYLPRWSGYTLGFKLVQSFLAENKKSNILELTSAQASIFSKYL